MEGYTVFSVDQIEDLPEHYYTNPEAYYSTLAHELTHNAEVRIMPCSGAKQLH